MQPAGGDGHAARTDLPGPRRACADGIGAACGDTHIGQGRDRIHALDVEAFAGVAQRGDGAACAVGLTRHRSDVHPDPAAGRAHVYPMPGDARGDESGGIGHRIAAGIHRPPKRRQRQIGSQQHARVEGVAAGDQRASRATAGVECHPGAAGIDDGGAGAVDGAARRVQADATRATAADIEIARGDAGCRAIGTDAAAASRGGQGTVGHVDLRASLAIHAVGIEIRGACIQAQQRGLRSGGAGRALDQYGIGIDAVRGDHRVGRLQPRCRRGGLGHEYAGAVVAKRFDARGGGQRRAVGGHVQAQRAAAGRHLRTICAGGAGGHIGGRIGRDSATGIHRQAIAGGGRIRTELYAREQDIALAEHRAAAGRLQTNRRIAPGNAGGVDRTAAERERG